MDIAELKKTITLGESDNLEFKTSTTNLKSIFETLCAFLNAGGGTVLIGVKDDGRIVGQNITDQTLLEVSNLIAKLEPPSAIAIEQIAIERSKSILKLKAMPSPSSTPYVFDGKPFWRIGSSTRLMPQQQYQSLLLNKANTARPWDAELATHITLDDLDQHVILETLQDGILRGRIKPTFVTKDPQEALQTLGLLKNGALTNAAGILFCKDSETHFPQNLLTLVRFNTTRKKDITDSKRIYGNAFTLLDETQTFLMRHMSIASEMIPGQFARKDHPEYSLLAAREAMVNAICHRDYRMESASISFIMYADRLEITSKGTLPKEIRLDDLKQTHDSYPRNPKITQAIYKRGYIESVGTGTQEMVRECLAIDAPEPEYIERGSTFVALFYKHAFKHDDKQKDSRREQLSRRQKEILKVMRTLGECTIPQILADISDPPTDRTLRNDLSKLESQGLVIRSGSTSGTSWKLT